MIFYRLSFLLLSMTHPDLESSVSQSTHNTSFKSRVSNGQKRKFVHSEFFGNHCKCDNCHQKRISKFASALGTSISQIEKSAWSQKADQFYKDARKILVSKLENGDKMEFRKGGITKLKYQRRDSNNSPIQDHYLNHDHFVIIRGYKKRGVKN